VGFEGEAEGTAGRAREERGEWGAVEIMASVSREEGDSWGR
jgi:hypothetical protein